MKKKKKLKNKSSGIAVKKKAIPKIGTYLNIDYESSCELSCLFFAEELMKLGYVKKVTRSPSYTLCNPVHNSYAEKLKRGSRLVTQTILQGVTYTPDYDIYFTEKALGIFCWDINSDIKWNKNLLVAQKVEENEILYRACCEVKPDFQRNSTTPKSVQSMKWLYQRHNIYVNLFRPNRIFEGLFVPSKYLVTERGTSRILKFKVLSLQEFLKKKA